MIAKIIPLKRLPRHIDILDYIVPTELEQILKIGQLVEIPFRQSSIFGLLFEFGQSTGEEKNLKSITHIVNDVPLVSQEYLFLLHTLTKIYATPIGSIAKMGLLPLQKNKLKKIELSALRNSPPAPLSCEREGEITRFSPLFRKRGAGGAMPAGRQELRRTRNNYFLYTTHIEHRQLFENISPKKTTLILVPEVRHIEEIKKLLSKSTAQDVIEWYSDLSTKEKFSRWLAIRNSEKNIIIGTRGTLLIPFPKLDQIIIDFEHDENHKHWDQAPRFHSKDIAPILQQLHTGCKITYASFSPSFDAYYRITKEHLKITHKKIGVNKLLFKKKNNTPKNLPIIANFSQQGAYDGMRIFSSTVEEHLEEHIEKNKGDVFIFINKKGSASLVICKNCGHIETDPESGLALIYKNQTKKLHAPYSNFSKPLPVSCPRCNSRFIKLLGIGSESVEKEINNMLSKESNFEVLRIDSDSKIYEEKDEIPKPRIIIGTQMAFQQVDWDKTKLIIFLDLDRQLALPEYLNTEHVWQLIAEAQYRRSDLSIFYIQTRNPEHTLYKSLGEVDRLYRTDLSNRQKLGYPPYTYLVRFFYGNYSNLTATQESNIVCKHVENMCTQRQKNREICPAQRSEEELTETQKSAILLGPFEMQPRFFRNKYWYGFLAKLKEETWMEDLTLINKELGIGWKIDPNPISLLSP